MSQLPPPSPPLPQAVPAAYEIQQDTTCLACGYNLRGLRSDGRCPECGTAIGRSLHGNFLRFAQPEYVRKLASGVTLILWGFVISIVVGLLAGALTAAGAPPALGQFVGLLAGLVSIIGTWQVTSPDPSALDAQWEMSARKLVRIALLVGLGSNVMKILTAGAAAHSAGSATMIAMGILLLVFGIIQLVGLFARFVYFGKLAMRIPDPGLAKSTRTVMWGLVISMALILFGSVIAILGAIGGSTGGGANGALAGFAVLACIAGVGLLVFGIWSLALLFKYRRSFIDEAYKAEQSWYRLPASAATPLPPAGGT